MVGLLGETSAKNRERKEFIIETLNKSTKDQKMLLKLESRMTRFVSDEK